MPIESSKKKVIIVGGGIIGIASAHFLSEAGFEVTVLDQGKIGAACSHGNCGLICPDHVEPLPGPGAFKNALAAMLNPNGPLKIRLGTDWARWKWMAQFGLNCNKNRRDKAARARLPLLLESREFYENFISQSGLECDFETRGCLFVHSTKNSLDHFEDHEKRVRNSYGIGAEKFSAEDLEKFEPALKTGVAAGAWYYPQDAHLRPDLLVNGWKEHLIQRGVLFEQGVRVEHFMKSASGRAGSVLTSGVDSSNSGQNQEFDADHFVVATGSWAPFLSRELGTSIPIQPGKGYSLTTSRPEICPQTPMIFEEEHVAVTPMQSAFRVGSTMEFVGYSTSIPPHRLQLLRQAASRYLQEPEGKTLVEEWYGWRPMTPDGLPRIGRTKRFKNVFVAAGHNMIGVMTAPATGKLIADLICDRAPSFDATPYQPR